MKRIRCIAVLFFTLPCLGQHMIPEEITIKNEAIMLPGTLVLTDFIKHEL